MGPGDVRSLVTLAGLAASVVFLSASAPRDAAAMVMPEPLSWHVAHSGVIFAGTVVSMTPRPMDRTIVTEVVFRDLTFVKDMRPVAKRDSLILRLLGGQISDDVAIDPDGPSFQVGTRYIILADDGLGTHHDAFSPVRTYVAEQIDSTGGNYVLFKGSRATFQTTDLDEDPYVRAVKIKAAGHSYQIRVSEKQFLTAIQEIMARDAQLPPKH